MLDGWNRKISLSVLGDEVQSLIKNIFSQYDKQESWILSGFDTDYRSLTYLPSHLITYTVKVRGESLDFRIQRVEFMENPEKVSDKRTPRSIRLEFIMGSSTII